MELSFTQYLFELDQGDLNLQNQHKDEQIKKKNATHSDFTDKMDQDRKTRNGTESKPGEPIKGDVLKTKNKSYIVVSRNADGFKIKELGSNKGELVLKHGYKYTEVGKTPLDKPIYKVSK